MTVQEIRIQGMGCDHCVSAVRKALEAVEGIDVQDVEIGAARLRMDPTVTSDAEIDRAIREAGYEPAARETIGG